MSETSSNHNINLITNQSSETMTQNYPIKTIIKPIFRHETSLNPENLNYYVSKRIETKKLSLQRDRFNCESLNIKERMWRKFETIQKSTKRPQTLNISIIKYSATFY